MADKVVEEVRVLKRGGGAAATFAFFALLLAIVGLILALRATNHANQALKQAKSNADQIKSLNVRLDSALGKANQASPGGGTGVNNSVQPATGNTIPNGNGQ